MWKAYAAQELTKGKPPLFERYPDAKTRLEKGWLAQCRAFDKATLDCANGVTLEAELAELRRKLKTVKLPPEQLDEVVRAMRAEWSVLRCKEVDRSLDRAAKDAIPRSDDCMGADLEQGRCQCAHGRCMDVCCPDGWVCAHSGAAQSKCLRP